MAASFEDKDKGWAAFFKHAAELADAGKAKVGVLGNAAAQPHHDSKLTVGEIAVINEFGTEDGHVPERSFLRSTFDESRADLASEARAFTLRVLDGRMKARQAVALLAQSLVAKVRRKITSGEGVPPPNAPSTIAAKGSSRPLVDTGQLVHAITYQIGDKEK